MGTAAEWNEVALALRGEASPFRSPYLPKLYALANADGPALLGGLRRRLGEDRVRDLVHDLLSVKLEALIAADEPRALFCVALQRRALSWLRRGDAAVVETPAQEHANDVARNDEGDRQGFVLDARDALAALSPRDRAISVAVAMGEDREGVAREFGTSRANVDQVVSRIRKRFLVDP